MGDTVCPICGKLLVGPEGDYVATNHVKDGRCGFCGAPVGGIWE